jgi:hypothetical protein
MNCRCGHPEKDHVQGGRCRVPDCPCELFQPGETLRGTAPPGAGQPSVVRRRPMWGSGSVSRSTSVAPGG